VTGYRATRLNPVAGYYEVQARDAHAWVEAWIEPHGWVSFEPTASMRLAGEKRARFIPSDLGRYVGSRVSESERGGSVAGRLAAALMSAAERLWNDAVRLAEAAVALCSRPARAAGAWALLLVPVTVGAIAAWRLSPRLLGEIRRRQLRLASQRGRPDSVFLCYRAMEWELARRRFPRTPCTTPREYARAAARRYPSFASAVATLTEIFEAARYGLQPPVAEQSVRAYAAYETIRRQLARPGASGARRRASRR
jgi:hypothetical protein